MDEKDELQPDKAATDLAEDNPQVVSTAEPQDVPPVETVDDPPEEPQDEPLVEAPGASPVELQDESDVETPDASSNESTDEPVENADVSIENEAHSSDTPAQNAQQTEPEEKKEKKRVGLFIFLIVVIAALVAAIVFLLFSKTSAPVESFNDDEFFDPLAISGFLPDMTEQEIQAELNRVVQEGMLNISISGDITFANGDAQGKANIMNSSANQYIIKVSIALDGTGEAVYESGGILPGQYIQYIALNRPLEAGDYSAVATFTAYTQNERQIVGSVAAMVALHILN